MKRIILGAIFALIWSAAAQAVPIVDPWTISGPGTTSATGGGGTWDLSYHLNPAGFSTVQWVVTGGPVTDDGDYALDWIYSGFHAFFQVEAFLTTSTGTTLVNVGPANCCAPPSGGFSYAGSYTFAGVSAGDTIGFIMGGENFDSNNVLQGNLHLVQTNVPAPAGLMLMLLGLLGFRFATRTA